MLKIQLVSNHLQVGNSGEELAEQFFMFRGFTVLEKNWRTGRLEVDLILKEKNCLIFCEVKTRSGDFDTLPEDAVTSKKINNLIKAAGHYIEASGHDGPVRFDLVSVLLLPHGKRLFYMPDAFFPMGDGSQ